MQPFHHTSSSLATSSRSLFAAASDSFLDKFLKNTISLAPSERADALNVNDDIEVEHQAVAEQGDSRVRSLDVEFIFLFLTALFSLRYALALALPPPFFFTHASFRSYRSDLAGARSR